MDSKSKETKSEVLENKLNSSEIIDYTFKHLARINGEINRMNTNELIERLKYYGLDTEGNDDIRRRRLKNNYRKIKLASVNINISNKLLPYYVVIDFEATCILPDVPDFQNEIIEFPAVLVNGITLEVEDTFQMYCKPIINPKLSDFCIELTGITQEQVDSANSFSHVLKCFENWLKNHKLGKKHKFSIVTDASWDMSRFLFQQCHYSDIQYPDWGRKWINLKRAFCSFYKCERMPLKSMLNYLEMEFEGRLHCGLDDAKNIARILVRMIRDGANIQPNEKITENPKHLRKHLETRSSREGCAFGNEKKRDSSHNNGDKNELNEKMDNLRIRAYFTVIGNKNQLSTYKKVKRERGKLEARMHRELKEKCDNEELREILELGPSGRIKEKSREN